MSETRMEPGRALDAMVAEKVMGWVEVGPTRHHYQTWQSEIGMPTIFGRLPRYSTDIGAAWQVVEKMRERGYAVAVETDEDGTGNWTCYMQGDGDSVTPSGITAPHAICLAALAALAESNPEQTENE